MPLPRLWDEENLIKSQFLTLPFLNVLHTFPSQFLKLKMLDTHEKKSEKMCDIRNTLEKAEIYISWHFPDLKAVPEA